jgi:hypothetical protein
MVTSVFWGVPPDDGALYPTVYETCTMTNLWKVYGQMNKQQREDRNKRWSILWNTEIHLSKVHAPTNQLITLS